MHDTDTLPELDESDHLGADGTAGPPPLTRRFLLPILLPLLSLAVPVDEVGAGQHELVAVVAVHVPGAGVTVDDGLVGAEREEESRRPPMRGIRRARGGAGRIFASVIFSSISDAPIESRRGPGELATGETEQDAESRRDGGPTDPASRMIRLKALSLFVLDEGIVQFRPARRLTREDVGAVVALIARRVERLLERPGLAGGAESSGPPDLWSEEAPVLAAVAAASVEGRVALGPRAGARVRRCGDPPGDVAPMTLGPCHAHADGFDLHAGLVTRAGQRDRGVGRRQGPYPRCREVGGVAEGLRTDVMLTARRP